MRLILSALAALALTILPASAQSGVQIGRLACDVDPSIGLILGSSKGVDCTFYREGGGVETYSGRITRVGFDIGVTAGARIEWLVFNAGDGAYVPGSLTGTYVGAGTDASFVVGGGVNWLVGGNRDSIALQPWSIQGQAGFNFGTGFQGLVLE